MKINEVFNFDTGRYIKKDGSESKFVYIVPELSEPIQKNSDIEKRIKELGGWEDKYHGVYRFNTESNYKFTQEELIDQIKRAIEDLIQREQPENGTPRDSKIAAKIIDDIINKINSNQYTNVERKEHVNDMVSEKESEDFKQKLEAIKEKLIQGISDYDGLKEKLLEIFKDSKFSQHSTYSGHNSFLIYLQDPEATEVKAAGTWKKNFNREVIDFSHPILMWLPQTFYTKISNEKYNELFDEYKAENGIKVNYKNKAKVQKEFKNYLIQTNVIKTGTSFKLYKAYDITATKLINPSLGDPINQEREEINYEDEAFLDKLIKSTEIFIQKEGINLRKVGNYGALDQNVKGMSTGGSIYLNLSEKDKRNNFSTLIHELTHEFAHQKRFINDNENGDYQDESEFYVKDTTDSFREQQAEVSAFTVLNFFHINADEKNLVYLHSWKLDPENAGQIFDSVVQIVGYIIRNIHEIFYGDEINQQNENKQIREKIENMDTDSYADKIFNQPIPNAAEIAKLVGKEKEYYSGKEMENESIEKVKKDFLENYQRFFGKKMF